METWQIEHIRKNLPTLIQATVCSTGFLVSLSADGIVSDDDVQILEAITTQRAQAKRLYEIIQTRKDSFNLLKQALKDTAQSGALAILDQCDSPNVPIPFKNCGSISYIRDLLLGRGCYGTRVFKGKFENRDVAVKRLNRDEVEMADVQEEVNLLILLDSHKNVVRYFKTEVTEDFIFIALELCDINLFDWVIQLQKDVEIGVIEIMKQTTEGVAHLHFHRVIHRDLKPTNILLVSRSVGDAQVKISDFGLSKRIPVGVSKLSGHTAGVGTVEWMAPEVAGGLNLQNNVAVGMSLACDIFSLGCVYYFVASGGLHAFGEPRRCQANIMDGKYQLNERNIASTEVDVLKMIKLISKMIAHERGERPTILEVLTWLPEVVTSTNSAKVHADQQNTTEEESAKHKHTSGYAINENPGNVGNKAKLALSRIDRPTGSGVTKSPGTVKASGKLMAHKRDENPTACEVFLEVPDVSEKLVNVSTQQEHAIKGESVKDKHSNGQTVCENQGLPKIASGMKAQLSLTMVDEHKSSQLTKSARIVAATSDIQTGKWDGEDIKEHTLHLAIERGDMQAIQKLIQLGADVNAKNSKNEAPLMIAAASKVDGNMANDIVKYLIDHGVDAFDTDSEGRTFLHKLFLKPTTVEPRFGAFINYLVDKNLSSLFIIKDTTFGTTPLMLAATYVELEMSTISLLRKSGVDLTLVDKIGASYLSYAAEGNKNGKLLVELMKNGDIKHNKLAEAIEAVDLDAVKVLVRLGADVNETNNDLRTPLHLAAAHGNKAFAINVIKFLIDSGANVDAKDKLEGIFLHLFIAFCTIISPTQFDEMATYLISKDLSQIFNTPGTALCTPFQEAVQWVEIERATLCLLNNNVVDFNAVDCSGYSVLYHATRGNRTLRMISDLVDLGANPKHLSTRKESMLHRAARGGNPQVVKFFLEKGLDINAQDKNGQTPLHWALNRIDKADVLKTVQLLLRNGARNDILDKDGKSPRDFVNQNRDEYCDADQISTCLSLGSSC